MNLKDADIHKGLCQAYIEAFFGTSGDCLKTGVKHRSTLSLPEGIGPNSLDSSRLEAIRRHGELPPVATDHQTLPNQQKQLGPRMLFTFRGLRFPGSGLRWKILRNWSS